MDDANSLKLEVQALRDQLVHLSAASLRINESLDVETVLQEVVDSARQLTDSRFGVITTRNDSGRPHDFVTSGISHADYAAMENCLPDGLRVYEYFSGLREPLRVSDYREYVASIGLSNLLPLSGQLLLDGVDSPRG